MNVDSDFLHVWKVYSEWQNLNGAYLALTKLDSHPPEQLFIRESFRLSIKEVQMQETP
jgi:hypothetical protein